MAARAVIVLVLTFVALTVYALWPICVPLSSEHVAASQTPLAERSDSYLFGRVFQQRGGQWFQCKTRIARALFF